MFDPSALWDLALGAAALAGVRGLRKDIKAGFKETAEALSLHTTRLDNHETRLDELEVIEMEAGEPTMLGLAMAAQKRK